MRKFALSAAIEKIRDVCVLLSLSKTKVVHTQPGKHFRENNERQLGRKSHRQRISYVVNRETNKVCVRPVRRRKIIEARNCQRARDLPRAIGAKIEEDNRVAI